MALSINPAPIREPFFRDGAIASPWVTWLTSVYKLLFSLRPSMSADNGDNDVTLIANESALTQRFNTPLTTNRTITLSSVNAYEGAKFRVIRQAGATGGSTLSVGGLKTLSVSEWADVEYTGTEWILTGHGSL